MHRLVCICGFKYSGKDYLADELVRNHGFVKMAIADRLKDSMKTLFNFTEDQVRGSMKEVVDPNWGITPRRAMEFIGTEFFQYEIQKHMNGIGRTFWIKSLIPELRETLEEYPVVISDMRFQHEYTELRDQFGDRTSFVRIYNPKVGLASSHLSESEHLLIKCTHEFINDPDISYSVFQDNVIRLLEKKLSTTTN